jgi:uncharacterized SAM-binding protein YcdF (DUF218 family)
LERTDAVVVLSSSLARDGELSQTHLERVLHGLELLRAGNGPCMVITQLPPPFTSSLPAVRRQMTALGLNYPIIETPGQVVNTHDEALEVSKLARSRGWRRVILVTHPFHMRRAAAVFQKAGLPVLRAPCRERTYLENDLEGPEEHLAAFRDWFHEWIGLIIYRLRGWI